MQEDALWVQQTLAGDRQAFGFLVRKYWRPIYAQILSAIHNHADAEELTNDAFVEAYLDLINLRRPSSFHNWLRQIARHRCLDWLRQRKETSLSLEELTDEVEAYLYRDSVEDQLLRQEKINKTLEAIGTLPEIDRCLMRDFYLKAEPYRILQGRYHLSKSAVKMRLFRARQKVKEQVKNLLSGFASLPWRDMGKLSLIKGVLEAVKMGTKVKLMAGGMAAVLMLGGAGILVWHFRQPEREVESSETMISQSPQNAPSISRIYSSPLDDSIDDELHNKPVVEQNDDNEQKAREFLAWLESLEQENPFPDRIPDASEDPAEAAERVVRNFLNAGIAGDWELYISYCRGYMKMNLEKQRAFSLELRGSIEESNRVLSAHMNTLTITGTERLDSDHAIVNLIVGYTGNSKKGDGSLAKYREGGIYDEIGYFSFYIDRYDDGWYITNGTVEIEKRN